MDDWSCAYGSKRNIKSLAKYPTINYTPFGCNNMSKFFDYQILTDIKLGKVKTFFL